MAAKVKEDKDPLVPPSNTSIEAASSLNSGIIVKFPTS
jgi:hypothetical protein